MEIPDDEMQVCLSVLQRIANARCTIQRSERFNTLISKVYREGKRYDQQELDRRQRAADREVQATTGMVQIQRDAVSPAALPAPDAQTDAPPPVRVLNQPEACYICKAEFTEVHFFYHLLCPKCAEYNYRMRSLSSDLSGRTAMVTGGRVKIGHQTVLRLLRDGANVIVTTRFPHAAAKRLYAEPDSANWRDRVRVFGLDLRNIPTVELFAQHLLDTEPSIDILIHNAAQTIRRPRGFYNELVAQEQNPQAFLPAEVRRLVAKDAPSTLAISDSSTLLPSVMPTVTDVLPADAFHDNEELADQRSENSWRLKLDDVGPQEMLEVQLVNSVAPFLLNSRLKPLMMRAPFERRFIVNVSAMEGQFARRKTIYHPHTNMAKAALNMMTRTSGDDYARDHIYMTSVDTGWVTDENPGPRRMRKQQETGFFAPLDIIDGMARIYHPIAAGINEPAEPFYGVFLKDYAVTPW
ncbi:MAG: SDR family oxidoreductase [Capsulimonadaceae bacterium]|nr:SDR family oxidoreductase [Capsulimonadaceae bacterium]